MTKLIQHIEEMRARLSQIATTERSHVQSLSDALNRLDQEILQSVRNIAAEHEIRRDAILDELQALAGSIGMLPPAREPVQPVAIQRHDGHPYALGSGNRSQATQDMSYHDELERNLTGLLNGKGTQIEGR